MAGRLEAPKIQGTKVWGSGGYSNELDRISGDFLRNQFPLNSAPETTYHFPRSVVHAYQQRVEQTAFVCVEATFQEWIFLIQRDQISTKACGATKCHIWYSWQSKKYKYSTLSLTIGPTYKQLHYNSNFARTVRSCKVDSQES